LRLAGISLSESFHGSVLNSETAKNRVLGDESGGTFLSGDKKMAKIAKTADRKKVMDTSKSTNCPKCGKATRIVKRVKDRERNVPGGVFISCSACEFYEKL
jgi:DNA-directed RNA polymerase subunit M/transcription elongation factor TFIIS